VDGALCSRRFGPMPKLAPLLAQRFTVFAYDRRGRGDSGDTQPYSKERELEDLDALIQAGVPSLIVYGGKTDAKLKKAAETIADTVPGARRRTLDGQTHNVAPKALTPAVVEFFTA
jgi:pimeloyl-ACP methyl ester carboxylesterase